MLLSKILPSYVPVSFSSLFFFFIFFIPALTIFLIIEDTTLLHISGLPRLTQQTLDCILSGGFTNLADLDISWCRYKQKQISEKRKRKKKKEREKSEREKERKDKKRKET